MAGGGVGAAGGGGGAVGGGELSKRQRVASWREQDNERLRRARLVELQAFVSSEESTTLDFSPRLNAYERKLVHSLAEEMGLLHTSHGEGEERFIRVEKPAAVA
jgi:predicted RNA-binding protein Jag